ncbi:interleukin-1 receptor type 1 [Trichomycterus rosablanca]|uniref:interleukin-1 receptor type 1 n=1 Tax=Trichomycterus rosablanca TaxID=2290929 RepID=UPI002F360455
MMRLWVIICFLPEVVMTSVSTDLTIVCESPQDVHPVQAIQGEAWRLPCPNLQCSKVTNHSVISWFKNQSDGLWPITTEESSRIHYHGAVLYFLPLTLNDTGRYITRWFDDDECDDYETDIVVYEEFHPDQLYGNFKERTGFVPLDCTMCNNQKKRVTWYKDFLPISKESEKIQVFLNSKKDEGIYTCLCEWEHNNQSYNSSMSFKLQIKESTVRFLPTIQYPINNSVKLTDLGSQVKLNCLVFFGLNVQDYCYVYWVRNNTKLDSEHGYSSHTSKENDEFRSTLTINKVSDVDLQSEFCCRAEDLSKRLFVCITLQTRESSTPVLVMVLCPLLLLLLAVGTAKWLAVDLVLFFRSLPIMQNKRDDDKLYDAYVIYQRDTLDEETASRLAHFVNCVLPAVLENDCGYTLYIHGRDELPGEDCSEVIGTRMQQSRQLIVVLASGTSQHPQVVSPQGYEWQLGLHQLLVEQELTAIVIQLGEIKDFSHLPLGLQNLLYKTKCLKWEEGSNKATCSTSRFWKQLRYMMPVPSKSSSSKLNFQQTVRLPLVQTSLNCQTNKCNC